MYTQKGRDPRWPDRPPSGERGVNAGRPLVFAQAGTRRPSHESRSAALTPHPSPEPGPPVSRGGVAPVTRSCSCGHGRRASPRAPSRLADRQRPQHGRQHRSVGAEHHTSIFGQDLVDHSVTPAGTRALLAEHVVLLERPAGGGCVRLHGLHAPGVVRADHARDVVRREEGRELVGLLRPASMRGRVRSSLAPGLAGQGCCVTETTTAWVAAGFRASRRVSGRGGRSAARGPRRR